MGGVLAWEKGDKVDMRRLFRQSVFGVPHRSLLQATVSPVSQAKEFSSFTVCYSWTMGQENTEAQSKPVRTQ